MRIRILAVGTKMPQWVEQAYQEYAKRLGNDVRLELVELPLGPRGKNHNVSKVMEKEGQAMLAAMGEQEHIVALDVLGKGWSTEQLSAHMSDWLMQGKDVCLLVGGPDGLAPECLAKAKQKWSLSPLTLPHPLVRILLAEQLYRAWTILHNHPYHK